jgi:adenine-specific DNA-methyltransferase
MQDQQTKQRSELGHTLLPSATNPAQSQHMLIEGENLEVLRVLQKSHCDSAR